jgi:molybdenum cofactor cytidylyltransferase/nicotine blue oxidoreductase
MGGPKAELVIDGIRLLDRVVGAARAAGCSPVYAVVREGTHAGEAVVIVNPEPDRGMRSSLECAVAAARDVDALAVVLVDNPGISSTAIEAVIGAWTPGRIAVARYPERSGHPIVMAPELWRAALAVAGPDEGARGFLAANAELVDEVRVPGDPSDLDTPDDLARWQAR